MDKRAFRLLKRLQGRFLEGAEAVYRRLLQGIKAAYRKKILPTHRLPVPIVSVGNLTWGGTGKTPLVLHLALALKAKGRRVAVLTRGYGRDEVRMLQERLDPVPVMVGPNRVATGRRAIKEMQAELLLLDDGFQQWRLKKDLEILMVDSLAPFGNGHLIPRGTLREPTTEAARADVIMIKESPVSPFSRRELTRKVRALNDQAPIYFIRYEPDHLWRWPSQERVPLTRLQGRKICTLAGIGQPKSFEATVAGLGGKIALKQRVRDHHVYTAGEMIHLFTRCHRHGIATIVTTAKDAIRIPELFLKSVGPRLKGLGLWVLDVKIKMDPDESKLLHRINSLSVR